MHQPPVVAGDEGLNGVRACWWLSSMRGVAAEMWAKGLGHVAGEVLRAVHGGVGFAAQQGLFEFAGEKSFAAAFFERPLWHHSADAPGGRVPGRHSPPHRPPGAPGGQGGP